MVICPMKQDVKQDALSPTQFLLYGDDGYTSHIVRFLLEEKAISYEFILTDDGKEELAELNPYKTLPILTNREISLYEIGVMFEYLEERHPANSLLPHTPKERAIIRTLAWRIQKDWLSLAKVLLTHSDSFDDLAASTARKTLSDTLVTVAPLFGQKPFFLSDKLTFCDILLVPFLWRLPMMQINLPAHLCRPLLEYQRRMTARQGFIDSLI